jgi:hypothetical protein
LLPFGAGQIRNSGTGIGDLGCRIQIGLLEPLTFWARHMEETQQNYEVPVTRLRTRGVKDSEVAEGE